MAERRMFAKTIIDSDAFLDMPLSTQSLYFHLSMRADDEGFINNPKKIQRMIGATEDDLKLLNAKNFIIPFESGVVVIKHWKIHNYIRGDRLVETQYKDEKALLTVKENGAYTIADDIKEIQMLDANDKRKLAYQNSSLPYSFTYKIRRAFEGCTCPSCGKRMTSSYRNAMPTIQHNVPISKGGEHELDNISVICESCNTSIRDNVTEEFNNAEVIEKWDRIMLLEKQGIKWFDNPGILNNPVDSQMSVTCQSNVSIGKDRLGKDRLGKDREVINYQQIADMYNDTCVSFPRLTTLSDARKRAIRARLNTYTIDDFALMFKKAEASTFLKGGNERNWRATFDWMIKDSNMAKILDGNYDDKPAAGKPKSKFNQFPQNNYDFNELEEKLLDN
jgi:5-methylcytosine-specific restriction endonuclease McrA